MERCPVKALPAAKRDLEDIAAYLNTLAPDAAERYLELFARELESLATMPCRCPAAHDPLLAEKGYRYLLVKNYLVFFVVTDGVVKIRRILYGRRDYAALL